MAERRRAGPGTSARAADNAIGPASPAAAHAPNGAHKAARVTIEITDAMRADVRRFAEIGTPSAIIARIMALLQWRSPAGDRGRIMFVCRFDDDALEFNQMMQSLWSQDGLSFTTTKG